MADLKDLWIPLWMGGALIIAAGTILNWMDISITFSDGTREIVSASGIELYSQYRGRGMPVESSAPLIYLLIAIGTILLAAFQWKDPKNRSPTLLIWMLVAFCIMIVSGTMAVDSMAYASSPSGADVHGIPEWLSDMAGKEVSNATIGGERGYLISIIGLLISFVAVLVHMRDAGSSP